MRGLARKLAAVVVGSIGTWLTTAMLNLGYSPDDVAMALTSLELLITLAIFGFLTFGAEHLLKYVKPLFPGDWADQVWRKDAGERVQPLSKEVAKTRIHEGNI